MKKQLLTAAVLALAATTQAAHAWGPTVVPNYVIYVGGGAEQNSAFEAIAKSLFLQDANLDVYTDVAAGTPSSIFRAIYGTLAVAQGTVPAGSRVLIQYRSNGGVYANGIGPVVRATQLPFLQILNNAQPTGNALPNPTYRLTNPALTINAIPDAGFANQEIGIFTGLNVPPPPAGFELTSTDKSNLSSSPLYVVANGIAVTDNLYAQKPSFTQVEIGAILAGLYSDWSQLLDASGNPLPAGPIVLIDRNFGSGAKAAANQYFLNNPGGKAFGGVVQPVNAGGDFGNPTTYNTYTVKTLPSAGRVGPELDLVFAQGQRGIGILGREYVNNATNGQNWSFVAINGVSAGVKNFVRAPLINGTYDYFYTASFNARNKAINGAHFAGDTSAAGRPYSDLISALRTAAQNPAVTTTIPGTLLDPNVVPPGTFPAFDSFVTKGTRFGNSAAPLQLQF